MYAISSLLLAGLGLSSALRLPIIATPGIVELRPATASVERIPSATLVQKDKSPKEPHPTLARFFNPWGTLTKSEESSLAEREDKSEKAVEDMLRFPLKLADELLQPFTGGLKSMLAESECDVALVIEEAHQALMADPRVKETLGENLEIGEVYYHASSKSSLGDISVRDQFMQFYIGDGHAIAAAHGVSNADGTMELKQLRIQDAKGNMMDVDLDMWQEERKKIKEGEEPVKIEGKKKDHPRGLMK